MKQNLLMLLGLAVLLTACGKNDEEKQTNAVTLPHTGQYPGVDFPSISNQYGYYYVSYSFYQDGCYTGRHSYYDYTEAGTRQQLCSALQQDWVNRGCARGMREAYFHAQCSGQTWSPR
jgi:hypothetical protein